MNTRNGIFTIAKKEFRRFFTDRRMVFVTVIMPGLIIFLLYTLMGQGMQSALSTDNSAATIYTVDLPASVAQMGQQAGLNFTPIDAGDVSAKQGEVSDQKASMVAVFPSGFDATLQQLQGGTALSAYTPPAVELYYNSANPESSSVYGVLSAMLTSYQNSLFVPFTVNAGSGTYDLASAHSATGLFLSMMMPLLLIIFLFSGCMSVATESMAGEKERGTIATLLVTPLPRWQLAAGKIVSLAAISLLAGLSAFIGTMASLPAMLSGATTGSGVSFSASYYGVGDYLMLLFIILSLVLLFVGLISLVSTFAKTVKEATTMVMPLMIIVFVVGLLGMLSTQAQPSVAFYLIPFYNSVECISGIFSFAANPANVAITVAENLVLAATCVVGLSKMLNSEKVMFNR
jgi:sodium transport system permease protein